MKIQIPVTFDSANRRKDKSVRLAFTTNLEISTPDYAEMDRMIQTAGWLLFSDNELKEEDVPTTDAPTRDGKSKGQRLRSVFFLIWKNKQVDEPFESWYDRQFERVLDKYKEQIDQ